MATVTKKAAQGAGTAAKINFTHEKKEDGQLRVTSGMKHRYKEVVDPTAGLGMCIGTLYVADHLVQRLGNPETITLTMEAAQE